MGAMTPGRLALAAPLLLAALAGPAATGCGGGEGTGEPGATRHRGDKTPANLLLLTVDTLRPDALGWVREAIAERRGRSDTPVLDRLAAEGLAFPAAVAPAPLTLPSHVTMMSGLVPPRHGVRDNGHVVGAAPALLAERLAAAGWTTAAFVSGFPLAARFGLDRGFSHYDDRFTAGEGAWLERPAPATTAAVLAWLQRAPRPWFLWVHYYDPHYPYGATGIDVPARETGRAAYAAEVALVDREIGRLRAALAGQEVLTVFAADHGESLGEHGEATHGYFIYDSTVLVPLVLHWPGRIAERRSDRAARLADLAPTVLDLLGQPPLPDPDGESLVAEGADPPPAYIETVQPWTSYGWAPLRGVRDERWKLVVAPRPELFDLAADRGESTNVIERHRAEARRLAALLRQVEARPTVAAAAPLADPETRERLHALGYLGAAAPASALARAVATAAALPDPKDRLEQRSRLTAAQEALERGEVDAALALFDEVLAAEPDNRFALSRSGVALLRRGDLERAIPRLERAARGDPLAAETRSALAEALTLAGRDQEAIALWTLIVSQQPRWAAAWGNLGTSLGRAGRAADAVRALERALALEPADPARLARLAFARHAAGDLEGAIRDLRLLAERLGAERFPHRAALGLLLLRAGRTPEARRWLAASRAEEAEYPEARLALARLLAAGGDREAAGRVLRAAAAGHPRVRTLAAGDPALAGLLSAPP
jgi:choline-sulfatase